MSVILILRHHPSNQSRAIECCKRLERVKDLQRYEYEPTEITVASARFRTIVPTLDWPEDGARVDTESRSSGFPWSSNWAAASARINAAYPIKEAGPL